MALPNGTHRPVAGVGHIYGSVRPHGDPLRGGEPGELRRPVEKTALIDPLAVVFRPGHQGGLAVPDGHDPVIAGVGHIQPMTSYLLIKGTHTMLRVTKPVASSKRPAQRSSL